MIPKVYSEGVSVCSTEVPYSRVSYLTECVRSFDTTYCTSVNFVTKFVPNHFITTLTVDEDAERCTTSLNIVPFFIQKTVPDQLTITSDLLETKKHRITTTVTRDPSCQVKSYISGIDLVPMHTTEVKIVQSEEEDSSSFPQSKMCNGDTSHSLQTPLIADVSSSEDQYLCSSDHALSKSSVVLMDSAEKTVREGEFWFSTSGYEKAFLMNHLGDLSRYVR